MKGYFVITKLLEYFFEVVMTENYQVKNFFQPLRSHCFGCTKIWLTSTGRTTRLPVRRITTTSTTTAPPPSTTSTPPLEPIPDPDRPAGNNKRPFTMVDAHTGEVSRQREKLL